MEHEDETLQPRNTQILASEFDPLADLRMAVERIKREPKPQPDMVPWDEYNWRDWKRGKRMSQQPHEHSARGGARRARPRDNVNSAASLRDQALPHGCA